MLVSQPEGNKTHQGQSSELSTIECQRILKFSKSYSNMKNYCGVHLQLLKPIDRGRLQGDIMLNPESQIKMLENNLKFLGKQNYSLKHNELKSKSSISLDLSDDISLIKTALPQDNSELNKKTGNVVDNKCSTNSTSIRLSANSKIVNQLGLSEELYATPRCVSVAYNQNSGKHNAMRNHNNVDSTKYEEPRGELNKHKEGDKDYEFTLEQENIVSFVCSPSPTRKLRYNLHTDDQFESDVESDAKSGHNACILEDVKSKLEEMGEVPDSLLRNNKTTLKSVSNENVMNRQPEQKSSFLWHPPSIGKYSPVHQETSALYNCCTLSNRWPDARSENVVFSKANSINHIGIPKNKKGLKTPFSQESVLFREASLRGCNNIENIIRNAESTQTKIEHKITKVKESIYSAVRIEKGNTDIVPDGIVAILNICKAWIKLNSHFEREDFKEVLELCGIDSTVVSDFLHWQCVSRTFIDKMVEALRKITYNKKRNTNQSWDNNGPLNPSFQGLNINKRFIDVPRIDDNILYFREPGRCNIVYENELSNSKHWKQRRFIIDQQHADKTKRTVKSKVQENNFMDNIPKYAGSEYFQYFVGQGPNYPLYYNRDYCFDKNSSFMSLNGILPLSSIKNTSQSAFLTGCVKPGSFLQTGTKGVNELCVLQRDHSSGFSRPMDDLMCCSPQTIMGIAPNHSNSMSVQTTTVSPYYNNQFCVINTGQPHSNMGEALTCQNPILCTDTEMTDNSIKSSYMKPGNYNPPQKLTNCLRLSNNSIPIKEEEVTGFSFLYSSRSQNILQNFKDLNEVSTSHRLIYSDDHYGSKTEDSWRDALSSAKNVRESLIATKMESPNLNLSETVSFKSHFLLSDEISQHSSSNDFKNEGECEEFSISETSTPGTQTSTVESCLKTTDWLNKSFNESLSENDLESTELVTPLESLNGSAESTKTLTTQQIHDQDENYDKSSNTFSLSNNRGNSYDMKSSHFNNRDCNFPNRNGAEYLQKKQKKSKRVRHDFSTYSEHPAALLHRKQKPIIKTLTEHIHCKLEDILNCIWRVEVSNLISDDAITEQEKTRLELNVRSPLYLQAMKCKLSNHSYDTLEQALADFQQYFFDTRSRNKGNKQSMEAVAALERLFFDLVRKNFGITKQYSSQIMGSAGAKTRRPKKTIRRC